MPAKSKRNRRNIPRKKYSSSGPVSSLAASAAPAETAAPERTVISYGAAPKAASTAPITYPYIVSEIKWIAIVTAIIAVLIVVLYVFLH